jgi:hypothetical protein
MAINTTIDAVQQLFNEIVKPADVTTLRWRIAELKQQLALSETQPHYPSQK